MYKSIQDIRRANKQAGYHFFDPNTMRFFNSEYEGYLKSTDKGAYFITSEQFIGSQGAMPRKFTVRFCDEKGNISTVGTFQEHGGLTSARNAIKKLISDNASWQELATGANHA